MAYDEPSCPSLATLCAWHTLIEARSQTQVKGLHGLDVKICDDRADAMSEGSPCLMATSS